MTAAVHQFVPSFVGRDAIGSHVLRAQQVLREMGLRSEIYADEVARDLRKVARHYRRWDADGRPGRAGGPTWLLYHSSVGSRVADYLLARPEPKLVDYHNITPPGFFEPWEPGVLSVLRAGRDELRRLAGATVMGLADSSYNEVELAAAGFGATAVVPILLDFEDYDVPADPRVAEKLAAGPARTRLLFVGRVAPNKAQHDLIRAFAAYRRLYDPGAVLDVVGGSSSPAYWRACEQLIADLGLGGSVRMTGGISFPALLAHYRAAGVFVCLSEHEGFCVPVLEAMHAGVPVVAYGVTAVPETVGDAALLLEDKDPVTVAAAIHRVVADGPLRAQMVAAGHGRVEHFSLKRTRERLVAAVERVVG